MATQTIEDVISHCEGGQCEDGVDCLAALCTCSECSCDSDAPGVEDVTVFALRAWKIKYGVGVNATGP